jgi:hypothetical protein
MNTTLCACGGTVTVDGPMDDWTTQMLRHVRDEQHSRWSAMQEADMSTSIIEVPVRRMYWAERSPRAVARSSSAVRTSVFASSVRRVA